MEPYERRRGPVHVTFISTYRCNLACEHCDIWRLREGEMDSAEAMATLLALSRFGARSLSFEGGEPLTRGDIGELISFCRERGIETSLRTNGTLVAGRLKALAPLSKLMVSLMWQDNHPNDNAVYEKALDAMRSARRAGIDVAADIVLTRSNIGALAAIIADASSIGVEMSFRRLEASGHPSDNSRFAASMPCQDELDRARLFLMEQKMKGLPIIGTALIEGAPSCRLSSDSFVVTPSGKVLPCRHLSSSAAPDWRSLGLRTAVQKARELPEACSLQKLPKSCNHR